MNYFAHGFRFTDRPYYLAGTAVPDLLGAADRAVRTRRQAAITFVDDCDPALADVAAGIVRHHDDDAWFHSQPAFIQLSLNFGKELREILPDEKGTRAGFLGHILVELILDAELIHRQPSGADLYYHAVASLDAKLLERFVNRIANRPTERVHRFVELFLQLRFLEDYADDAGLLMRVNQVLHRVGLDEITVPLSDWLPTARGRVSANVKELLPPL